MRRFIVIYLRGNWALRKFLRQIWFRLKYRIIKCIQQIQFYYKVLRQPILIENPPIATTLDQDHRLRRIEFTPKGATLHFHPVCVREPVMIDTSYLYIASKRHVRAMEPFYLEGGDTFTPYWELEFTEPSEEIEV